MRLATTLAVALALTLPATLQVRSARADVVYEGLHCQPLGGAILFAGSTPTGRRLEVHNLGSSGQDGVSMPWPASSKGHVLNWDAPSDLPDGSSMGVTLRGVVGPIPGVAVAILIRAQDAFGNETLTPDFSALHPTAAPWVIVMNGDGTVLKRVHKPFVIVKQYGAATPSLARVRVEEDSPTTHWIQLSYESPVEVSDDQGSVICVCTHLRFMCDSGDHVSGMSALEVTGAAPGGTPPVSFTVTEAAIVPPCAGCPNGPDDAGTMVAQGDAQYGSGGGGGGGGGIVLDNLGSSGQDGVTVLGERGCCRTRELSITATDATGLTSDPFTVRCDASGSVGGVPGHSLGSLSSTVDGSDWSFVPDFSAIGAGGYHVLLYRNGFEVGDIPNPPDGVRKWGDGHVTLMKAYDDGSEEFRIICITSPCPGWPVTVGGAQYLVDEMAFQPLDPVNGVSFDVPDDISSMEMTTQGAAVITISGTNFRSSAPTVGVGDRGAVATIATARLAPNPAPGRANVLFALPQAARAKVAVIDVAGRQVRGLADSWFAAGEHLVHWNGLDDQGSPVRAGVYFLRIDAGGSPRIARLTLLR